MMPFADPENMTVTVTAIRNPFDPLNSREIRKVHSGQQIRELVRGFDVSPGYDVAVSVDGRVLTSLEKMEYIPSAGSSVVFCAVPKGGGGKNPLAIVAMLALMVVTYGVVNPAVIGVFGGATGFSTLGFLATTSFLVAGSLAIQAIFPMAQPDAPAAGSLNSSSTYAWDKGSNNVLEGYPLPEVFGTVRVTPPLVGHYVFVDGDKQYINLLFAIAGHPLYSLTSIRINDTPIENMIGINYEPTRDYRDGSVNQAVLQHFDDTRIDTAVGVKLTDPDTYTTRTTTGNAVNGFMLTFAFPRGIYYMDDNGAMQPHTIKIYAEWKRHEDPTWTKLERYNTTTHTIAAPRWSAGYWSWDTGDDASWHELEAGGTTHDDPLYADPPNYPDGKQYFPPGWVGPPEEQYFMYFWRYAANNEDIFQQGTLLLNYIEITRSQMSPVYHTTTPVHFPSVSQPAGSTFDLRCKIVEALPTSARYGTEVWWEGFQEVVIDDFTYPGVALLALRALATDQLSGSMPRVDMLARRVYVPVVWLGNTIYPRLANNPAWACYHLLHQARYKGTGSEFDTANYNVAGVPADRIDRAAFQSWADWCEIKGYTVDLYIDQAMSMRKALDTIATLGRGCVVQMGSKFSCIVDRIEVTPVQRFLFTTGNIVADSFQEEWLPVTDRANAIEVTYFDSTLNYDRAVVTIYAEDFDTAGHEINTMQATLYGCVNRDMAIKYGKFLINSNKYLTLTCSFDADVDAIACIPGDVIEVAHDVPQWGYGGRVVSATTNTITFDRPVTIVGGTTYHVMVKHQDDDAREEKTVTTGAGTYTTVSISGTWTKIPALHALYSFGEVDHVVKEFRVLRITRSQEMRRKLTCLEYVAAIYEDGATIPPPESDSDLPWVTALTASEVYRGGSSTNVYLKWRGYAITWNVFKGEGTTAPELLGVAVNPSYEIRGLGYGVLYTFYVSSTDNYGDGESVGITLRGKIDPPGDVPSITYTEFGFSVLVEWEAVTDFDLWGYELRGETISEPYPYPNFTPNWSLGGLLFKGNARSYIWTYKAIGAYCLHVRAVDAFGNVSVNSATVIIDVGRPDQLSASYLFSGPNAVMTWNVPFSPFAIDHYAISYGADYESATDAGTTKGTTFSINVTWGGTRTYWIVAVDVAGNNGTPENIDVIVVSPGSIISGTPRVIDNNVLLQWSVPTTGSLPIAYYEVSKGDVYATAVIVGTVKGTFAAIFEDTSGEYTYWVVGYDSAGNVGTPVGIPATVNQPPDYLLLQNWTDDWSGTKASAYVSDGKLYAPVNITETYTQHFTVYSNDTPQEQIDVGFPLWIQPVPNTATYTRVFDYGVLITPSTKITLEVPYTQEYGAATIAATIEVSTNGSSWGSPVSGFTTIESGFRHVRAILTVTGGSNTALLRMDRLNLKLDLKQITDAGRVEVASNGVQVDFNKVFIDVVSITVAPEATSSTLAVYDFTDVPNPTHFHIYLFNPATGADASGSGKYVSWTARGV